MVANSLSCLLNLEIEVRVLLQGDGTTPSSILLFLFHGVHFKECGKSGTKPYVTATEQQCVSHHIFSHMMGKRLVLVELELHHRKTCRCIQMLTFGGEGVIVSRPNLRVAGASVYAWLYDYGSLSKVYHKQKAILLGDMAHISVLITASFISSPSEYADMIKTTTQKSPSNFSKLVESLFEKGYDIVSGGTENHLVLVNLSDKGIDGSRAEKVLESVHIAAIKNNVPGYVFAVVPIVVMSIESPFSFESIVGVEGLEIDKGYIFPQFATNPEKLFVEVENAGVLITDQKISRMFKVVEDCRAAGILVMVITGDNQNIAEAICREIGVFGADEDIHSRSPTGKEFISTLRDPKVHLRQGDGLLFSRVEPKHKQKIVRLLKEDGEVVAMTVDGVNDASISKLADIEIAMGISRTEVLLELKESAAEFKQVSTIPFLSLEDKANF